MSKVRVSCPKCESGYSVEEALVGKRAKCAKCETKFVLRPSVYLISGEKSLASPGRPDALSADGRVGRSFTAEDAVPAVWQPGDVILDLYEVTGILGEGGMGTVYKVRHTGWNVDLAVKSPLPQLLQKPEAVENFVRECGTWVNLGMHPHTVSCHYVRNLGRSPRVFAEYVAGGDLETWIKSGKLYEGGPQKALERILDIAIQIAWGLHYAHEQGLVHQDVKPANVMMTAEGTAKVTDFGLANARTATDPNPGDVAQAKTIRVTGRGGTVAYWSPEQAAAQAQAESGVARHERTKITKRADIWGWATSVLEMFLGETLWGRGQIAGTWLEEAYPETELEADLPRIPDRILDLLRQCLQRDPALRPGDMLAIASALQKAYQQITGSAFPRAQSKSVDRLADGLNNQALSLLDLGHQEHAEHLFDKALQHDPHHPQATYNRGLLLWRAGRMTDDALVRQLRDFAQSQAETSIGKYLLACIHLERGDCESAIPLLEECERLAPGDAEVVAALTTARSQLPASGRCLRTFEGHAASVNSVSFSPDGRLALSGSYDSMLRLWEVATGGLRRTFEGHTRDVYSVSFSPDGRLALSGSRDVTLRLWEVTTGRCVRAFKGHKESINSVSFSPDGRLALSGSDDKTLRLWDVATGRCLRTFEGHTGGVRSVSCSPDGRLALSGSYDKTLRLWEVATGRCLRTFEGHTDDVRSVSFSPDGRLALSGSDDKTVWLWEVATGSCLRSFEGHTNGVRSVSFSPDGRRALSGSDDATMRLWQVATGRCLRTFEGHTSWLRSVSFSSDGQLALSGGLQALRLWELATGIPQTAIFCRPETSQALTERVSRIVELQGAALSRLQEGHPAQAYQIIAEAMSLPGFARSPELIELRHRAGSRGQVVGLFAGWHLRTFEGHTRSVESVSFSPDGRQAESKSEDSTVRLWEVATGRCISCSEGDTDEARTDGAIIDYAYELEVRSKSFSPDGELALSGRGATETLRLSEANTGRWLRTFQGHTGVVTSVSFSPDGELVLSGSEDKTLRLWDVATGRCLRTFEGHTDKVSSVSFSLDGRLALSGSGDYTLRLWELVTGRCLRTFEGHTGTVNSVSFSPDGRHALSGSEDKTVRLWELVWNYEFPEPADWDEGSRPYLQSFLDLKTLDQNGQPATRPTWSELDFQQLIDELQNRGYGWLRPEGVRRQLQQMAAAWTAPPNLSGSPGPTAKVGLEDRGARTPGYLERLLRFITAGATLGRLSSLIPRK
jgi:WD40 repeat protein/serine/threonine protein kinase